MSYYFECGKQTLWNPSSRVGLLYVAQTESVARVLKIASGLEGTPSDEALVDADVFSDFVNTILGEFLQSNHEVLRLQLLPVLLPAIVMLDRAGHPIVASDSRQAELIDEATALAASMAD